MAKARTKNPKTNTDDVRYWIKRGQQYLNKMMFDKAIECFTAAIILKSDDSDILFFRGTAYMAKEDFDNAIADYNAALLISPEDSRTLYSCGEAYFYKEDYSNAIFTLSRAIKEEPYDPAAQTLRGYAYIKNEMYENAIADLSSALNHYKEYADRFEPDIDGKFHIIRESIEILYNRGNAYYLAGQKDMAVADYQVALSLSIDIIDGIS